MLGELEKHMYVKKYIVQIRVISDGLKVLASVAKPIGEANKGTTFKSVRVSRLPTARCAGKGVWGLPHVYDEL